MVSGIARALSLVREAEKALVSTIPPSNAQGRIVGRLFKGGAGKQIPDRKAINALGVIGQLPEPRVGVSGLTQSEIAAGVKGIIPIREATRADVARFDRMLFGK